MKKIFLTLTIITSMFFVGCSNDEDSSEAGCKTCDDFASSGATLEVCDNGDDTATVTILLLGFDVHNEVINIESDMEFSELECSYFNGLVDYEFE